MPSFARAFQFTGLRILLTLLSITTVSCGQGNGISTASWADAVELGDIHYTAVGDQVGRPLQPADLGQQVARVRFKLDGHVANPSYQMQDGDATLLDVGTPLYTLRGYKPAFRIAARVGERIVLYQAFVNPNARLGSDLLDIAERVRYIGVNSSTDGTTELAAITDPLQVAALATMALNAPVKQQDGGGSSLAYFITFHLEDGTSASCPYLLPAGELCRGIFPPEEFRAAIEQVAPFVTPTPNR